MKIEKGGYGFNVQQKKVYHDINPYQTDAAPGVSFVKTLAAAKKMGWEIVASDAAEGRIEATATTPFVGFKDDVVIRVRAKGAETLVDVRSKSRFGRGDMGVNAARIREFRDELIEAANP